MYQHHYSPTRKPQIFNQTNRKTGDIHIHNLIIEASWAAKYAGLSDLEAINLVSRNIEKILDLPHAKKSDSERDFVIWEGDALDFGASVVLAIDGEKGEVLECWPDAV